MKTLAEFIQRLQDDAKFEQQAQAFDHRDDLMAFVKLEGYDFTLEQLMDALEPKAEPPVETGGQGSAGINPVLPSGPDEAEFSREPGVFSGGERDAGLSKEGGDGFTPEPPMDSVPPAHKALPPPGPEDEPRAGLFKGGGRHRGFSPQRLKSVSEDDS